MLAAQNEARRRLNLAPLSWSADLADRAVATAIANASVKSCNRPDVSRAGDAAGAAVYWAASLPRYSGGAGAQTISPSFVVSEWQAGRGEFDKARGACRNSGDCPSWARMVAPTARQVGCARVLCPSQAQVWACHYDTPAPPKPPAPDLRRRVKE
jgi:pathogenesis-related protein 1